MNFVFIHHSVGIFDSRWHLVDSSKWYEEVIPGEEENEEQGPKMTDDGWKEFIGASDIVVLTGDLQLRDPVGIVHVVVRSLLRQFAADVVLNLNERAFVGSSNAVLHVHPDHAIILLHVLNIQLVILVRPDVDLLHVGIRSTFRVTQVLCLTEHGWLSLVHSIGVASRSQVLRLFEHSVALIHQTQHHDEYH